MKYNNLFFITLVLFLSYKSANSEALTLQENLVAYWPIYEGSLKQVIDVPYFTNIAYNNVPTFINDRLNRANDAVNLQTNNVQLSWEGELPYHFIYGFSIGFRGQISQKKSDSIYIQALASNGTMNFDLKFGEYLATDPLNDPFKVNQWQVYIISVDIKKNLQANVWEMKVQYYVDDVLVSEENFASIDPIKPTKFVIGDVLNNNLVYADDVFVYKRDLTVENTEELPTLLTDIAPFSRAPIPSPISQCVSNLANLNTNAISIDFQVTEHTQHPNPGYHSIVFHFYSLDFGDFQFLEGCYDVKIFSPTKELNELNGNFLEFPAANQFKFYFEKQFATSKGCVQVSNSQLECHLEVQVLYNGVVQLSKKFRGVVTAIDFNNISGEVQLQVLSENSDQVDVHAPGIETEIGICADPACTSIAPSTDLVRNEVAYVEFKVTNPAKYANWIPVHKSIKLGGVEIIPENLVELQSWSTPGKIIYAIIPTVSSSSTSLQVTIGLTNPDVNNGRRFLQEQELEFTEDDKVGKQIYIAIIDRDNNNSVKKSEGEKDNTGLYIGATLGGLALVSFSVSVIAFTIIKVKKMTLAAQAAKVTPVEAINNNIKAGSLQQQPQSTSNMWDSQVNLQANKSNPEQ